MVACARSACRRGSVSNRPFDAVLLISFGGPEGLADIRPFLANVLRGRRVSPQRVEAVVQHYERFGGVSPLTALTRQQALALEATLVADGLPLPVYVGMRNWKPYLPDTLAQMSQRGLRRTVAIVAAAHPSYSACGQYRENVRDARITLTAQGRSPVDVVYAPDFYLHPGFVTANADHVRQALAALDPTVRSRARVVFTAHSIPVAMAEASVYREALRATVEAIAQRLSLTDWALAYQSRSGRPEDPWLGPDVCDYLRDAHTQGLSAVVISPVGFVCDHIEVLYDLDHEAAALCRTLGIPMVRAQTVNSHPAFIRALADLVHSTVEHHSRHRVLPLVGA